MTQGSVSTKPRSKPKGAWRTLALAFLAQNFAIGLSIGSFGVSVLAIQSEFNTSRTLASLGGSLEILMMGALGPLVAILMERFTIRGTMLAGVVLGSIGYVALWAAPNIWVFLAAYALLVGPGVVMAGNLPGSTLVTNWFPVDTGRAIGLMMMPLFIMLVPLASTPVIEALGLRNLYLVLAAVNLLMFPLLLLVKDRPPAAELASLEPEGTPLAPAPDPGVVLPIKQILMRVDFWILVAGLGVLNGSGMVKISHLVALVAEQGRSINEATLLLTVSGGAGVVGSLVFGWLADRIGGPLALMINGLIQAATWTIFFLHPGMPLLFVDATLMGICGAGVFSAYLVTLVGLFGRASLARALGLAGIFAMAATFAAPPVAGLLYDVSGNYGTMLTTISTACFVAALCMGALAFRGRGAARVA